MVLVMHVYRCRTEAAATQKGCLNVVWAVLLLTPYLRISGFMKRTDLQALERFQTADDASALLVRGRLHLLEFVFEVMYRAGIEHQAPTKYQGSR